MKTRDFKRRVAEMSDAELDKTIEDLSKERYNLAVQAKTGQLSNPGRVGGIRRDIARIRTEQGRRRAAAAAAARPAAKR